MAYNGAGVFERPVADYASGNTISSSDMNTEMDGMATGLSTAITKDGQTVITANLPMANFKHTGVGNATARTHYAAAGQVADGALTYGGVAGGTADALTIAPSPAITAYAIGQQFQFKVGSSANTTAATLNVNSVGAGSIIWPDGTALVAGDLPANAMVVVVVQATTPVFHLQTSVSGMTGYLMKSGGTMTGLLTLSGDPTSALHAATKQYVDARVATGDVKMIAGNSAPSGWLECNGNTIGSASSSATARANADTEALFTVFWNSTDNADLVIQDSSGTPTTRGGSASADFAANKRMPLPDFRDYFPRGKSGSRANLSTQADAMQAHEHLVSMGGSATANMPTRNSLGFDEGIAKVNNGAGAASNPFYVRGATEGGSGGGTSRTATETRPKNIALMFVVKL